MILQIKSSVNLTCILINMQNNEDLLLKKDKIMGYIKESKLTASKVPGHHL